MKAARFHEKYRGIEVEHFLLAFTGRKIIFLSKHEQPSVHVSVSLKTTSGIFDVHKTTVGPSGRESDETLFAITEENALRLFNDAAALVDPLDVLPFLRPLRFGRLRRQGRFLLSGLDLDIEQNLPFVSQGKGRRLKIDPQGFLNNFRVIVDYRSFIEVGGLSLYRVVCVEEEASEAGGYGHKSERSFRCIWRACLAEIRRYEPFHRTI